MPNCTRCQRPVKTDALVCPHCQAPLKAFGHPGIPLHRAAAGTSLCATCTYHADNSCDYPQRPNARECTMYRDKNQPIPAPGVRSARQPRHQTFTAPWWRANQVWIALSVLVLLCVLLTLRR
jgi:hypothetical protein